MGFISPLSKTRGGQKEIMHVLDLNGQNMENSFSPLVLPGLLRCQVSLFNALNIVQKKVCLSRF